MWDDYEDMFRDEYGRLSYKMCDTQYNFNRREYEREVKFLFQDKTHRHYQLGNCYFEIPISLNLTSVYNKLDYIEKHYPSLNDTQLLKITKFLSKERIIPVAEWHEIPKKELTADEKFEELKNNIRKKNEIQRKPKEKVSLVTVVALMMLLVTLSGIVISKGVIQ